MDMIGKVGIGLVAFSIFISIIFVSTAEFIKPAQAATVVAAGNAPQSRVEPAPANGPLNSKEALQGQLKDRLYK